MMAFYGRRFFAAVFQPGDLQAAVAALEAGFGRCQRGSLPPPLHLPLLWQVRGYSCGRDRGGVGAKRAVCGERGGNLAAVIGHHEVSLMQRVYLDQADTH
jgi:hypothetical protein